MIGVEPFELGVGSEAFSLYFVFRTRCRRRVGRTRRVLSPIPGIVFYPSQERLGQATSSRSAIASVHQPRKVVVGPSSARNSKRSRGCGATAVLIVECQLLGRKSLGDISFG